MDSRKRRRWFLAAVAAAVGLLCVLYAYMTNPARLRARALAALSELPLSRVDLGEVAFSPWRGLQLADLVISPRQETAEGARRVSAAPPLLRVARVEMACDLVALLSGRLEPSQVRLDGLTLSILCPGDSDIGSVDLLPEATSDDWRRLADLLNTGLPPLRVTRADLQLMVMEHGRPRVYERCPIQAVGEPAQAGYRLQLERLPSASLLAELQWRRATGDLELSFDWANLEAIEHLMPARWWAAVAPLGVAGRVQLQRLVYRLGASAGGGAAPDADEPIARLAAADIRMDGLRFAIPLERDEITDEARAGSRSAGCFLNVVGADATLTYQRDEPDTPGRVRLHATGSLNGAPASLNLVTRAAVLPRCWRWIRSPQGAGAASGLLALDDVVHARLELEQFDLPTKQTAPDFVRCRALSGPVGATFARYEPEGKVNLTVRILRSEGAADSKDRVEVVAEGLGVRVRYHPFPYVFEDVRGFIRFAGGRIQIDDVLARHAAGWGSVSGVVNNTRHWTGFDVTFRAKSIALDGDLYEALPPEHQRLWRRSDPLGICDMVVRVHRPEGTPDTGPLSPRTVVDANLLRGSLTLEDGRRLVNASGRFTIDNQQILIHDLHGFDGEMAVRLAGHVAADGEEMAGDVRVEAIDMPVDYSTALANDAQGRAQRVVFAGRADAWGRVHKSASDARQRHHLAVRVKEGELRGFDPSRTWSDSEGWILVRDGVQEILAFSCRQGAARLNVTGRLPTGQAGGDALALYLRADTPAVRSLLPQFVPADWIELANSLGLDGAATVDVHLLPAEGAAAAGRSARVWLQADSMKASAMPLTLSDVEAELSLAPGDFELHASRARVGADGEIEAEARGRWSDQGADASVTVTARGLSFTPELMDASPKPLGDLLKRLQPKGDFDAFLPTLRISGAARKSWRFEGRVPFRGVSLSLGLDLEQLEGVLFGLCEIDPNGQARVATEFEIHSGRIAGRPIENWKGQMSWQPGDRCVRLLDMHGELCDGEAVGSVAIDPDSGEYELSLALRDVSAGELFPPPEDQPERQRRGRLNGRVHLTGRGKAIASRLGGGDLRIRGAAILQTPVLASVAQADPERAAIDDTVDQADVRFLWEGSILRLQRVDIQSENIRLIGEGTWDLRDDTVRMTLLGAHPRHWQRVPVLTDIVETAGQNLIRYTVEGPLSAPKVSARPLYHIDEALRILLGQEP